MTICNGQVARGTIGELVGLLKGRAAILSYRGVVAQAAGGLRRLAEAEFRLGWVALE